VSRFLSEKFKTLETYVPGEQPAEGEYIKLNTNESPYPPAPGVISAIKDDELKRLRLYPNPDGVRLLDKLAAFYSVGRENVIIGNGSDELLAFAFLAFCDSGRGVVFPDITYGFYPVYAKLFGLPYQQIPLNENLAVDPVDYCCILNNIIIANPNAPTGTVISLSDIESIVRGNRDHVVLIDEAYVGFGADSAIPLTRNHENLLVIHTYSKSRSMAGARLAYTIGPAPLIDDLNKMKYSFNPYNVNRLTQRMGEAAIDDEGYYAEKRSEIVATREYTAMKLRDMGFIMTDSMANFIFTKPPGIRGFDMYAALKEKGILVRQWNKPRISDYLRITIGTKEQMDALIDAVAKILDGR